MSRQSRVTLDIDVDTYSWVSKALRAYYGLSRAADEVEVRISSSGSGLHMVGWFDDALDDDQKTNLRRTLGDDAKRLELDTIRSHIGHTTNALWTAKGEGGGQIDASFDHIEDALSHISMTNVSMTDEAKARVTGNPRHAMLPK